MFYKQLNSAGQLISIGQTIENTILPVNFIEISKAEYDSFQRIFSMELDIPELTPLNDRHEIILN